MNKMCRIVAIVFLILLIPILSPALDIDSQFPTFSSKAVSSTVALTVVFDQSLNPGTVQDASFYVTKLGEATHVPGSLSVTTTNLSNDTVILMPGTLWEWAQRYELSITSDLKSQGGDSFSGVLIDDGLFVANLPNDLEIPVYDPANPFDMFVDSLIHFGFNPLDPEADADPWEIPGMNLTGAWKYSTGNPEVIIAVVDDGIKNYYNEEIRQRIFINAGELPLPNIFGTPCAVYDCNGDGRFNVVDYANDDRMPGPPPHNAQHLIDVFSDSIDDDGNGLPDDIAGWDFLRNTNVAYGEQDFPEGTHGDGQMRNSTGMANNNEGDSPGTCPDCMVLPIRTSAGIIYNYALVAAGVKYAHSMGASVISHAGVSLNWSEENHQAILDAFEDGTLTVSVSNDEMTFHHWMPGAGEDVLNVKSIFPMVPLDIAGILGLDLFAFTETFCTGYGSHVHVAVPSASYCTSEAIGLTSGALGLIYSYGKDLGIDLSADEVKQIMTMTAYDVEDHCASIANLLGVCQKGYDEHFGYGRPDLEQALLALGDPDRGIDPTIPPSVRVTSPRWWETFDFNRTPNLEVEGQINSRVIPYKWELQIAKGRQPLDSKFQVVDSGTTGAPIDGLISTIPLKDYFTEQWATGPPKNQYAFDVTVRVQAFYATKDKRTVMGESRKTISVHLDDDPKTGLLQGFPLDIGASTEFSPVLYDLDGDPDRRLEIVFGTGAGTVVAVKYNNDSDKWEMFPGFPVDLSGDDPWVNDAIFSSISVADLFGDGAPEIVAATQNGLVYAIDPMLAALADPILAGFPVTADPPDNTDTFTFSLGNGFMTAPVLADLDSDGMLEIVAASLDQKVYAWKPRGTSGQAEALSGWPVFCRSDPGLVAPGKVCEGNDLPNIILGTPAVGILDPDSSDTGISQHPSVVVATGEACNGLVLTEGRVYAIFHDGMEHAGGPFLPGWPAQPRAPLGGVIPIMLIDGSTSSPTVYLDDQGAHIAFGSTAWLPQVLHYKDGKFDYEDLVVPAINVAGSPAFSSLRNDGDMQYIMPLTGVLKFDELGVNLFNSRTFAIEMEKPHEKVMEGEIEDISMLLGASVADLNNDGTREVLSGSGGYLVHAHTLAGGEAPGWPKYTQKWIMAAPAVGDMDADGKLEVVVPAREGFLYAWESEGNACPAGQPNSDWRRFHHDERNTGFYAADTLPPIRTVDLMAFYGAGDQVRLKFTAPGDDWGCGTAFSYDIRYSEDESADLSDPAQFEAATVVNAKATPQAGGETESFFVDAPGAVHIALRTTDEVGNISFVSNDTEVTEDPVDDDDDDNDAAVDDDDDDTGLDDDDVSDDDDDDDKGGCGC